MKYDGLLLSVSLSIGVIFFSSCEAPLKTIQKVIPGIQTLAVMIGKDLTEDHHNSIFMSTNDQVIIGELMEVVELRTEEVGVGEAHGSGGSAGGGGGGKN